MASPEFNKEPNINNLISRLKGQQILDLYKENLSYV